MAGEGTAALVQALDVLVKVGRGLLEDAEKQVAEGSLHDFVSNKIRFLFGMMGAGAAFLNSLSVKNMSEAEDLWKNSFQDSGVREQVEEFLSLEVEWDNFLERLDSGLQTSDELLAAVPSVQSLSADMHLTSARSGEDVTLGHYFGQGKNLLLVLIRHFG
uniref:Uncharacterized protein n=2 Tax=Denticeps clupeoides TaxID=299321 RepID=A0AAY4CDM3_9TELE